MAVQVVSHEVCAAAMDPWMAAVGYGSIDAGFLCAGAAGKDACYGDSGGPLTSDSGDQAVLIGAVSTGDGCAKVRILRGSPDKSGASHHKYPLVQYSLLNHSTFAISAQHLRSVLEDLLLPRLAGHQDDLRHLLPEWTQRGHRDILPAQCGYLNIDIQWYGIIIDIFSSHHHHFSL